MSNAVVNNAELYELGEVPELGSVPGKMLAQVERLALDQARAAIRRARGET